MSKSIVEFRCAKCGHLRGAVETRNGIRGWAIPERRSHAFAILKGTDEIDDPQRKIPASWKPLDEVFRAADESGKILPGEYLLNVPVTLGGCKCARDATMPRRVFDERL